MERDVIFSTDRIRERYNSVPAPPPISYAQTPDESNINRAYPKYDYAPAHFSYKPQVEVESLRGKFGLS